jgi:apyrase
MKFQSVNNPKQGYPGNKRESKPTLWLLTAWQISCQKTSYKLLFAPLQNNLKEHKMRKAVLITATTLFISLATIALADSQHYSIIVDAGSTGSKLHVYQYTTGAALPVVKEILSESVKPGLSSFTNNPEAAGESLKKILDDAVAALKTADIDPQTVSVNVLATAGMRLLPPDIQHSIYKNVKHYINSNYSFPVDQVETISGQMEGVYGWVDVNYLAKNFENSSATVGTIDMGGASTQIAFETSDTSKPEDKITVKIGKKTYTLFSKSFLGLGQDQALAAMNKSPMANACYPVNYVSGNVTGDYHFTTCGFLYTDVIQQHHVAEAIVPIAGQQFIAYSGAYYNYHFLGADKTPDQAIVEQRIQSICTKSWEQLQQDYPQESPKYLANYCAHATYLDNLFYGAYHLQDSQLKVTTVINQQDIDWTLGALLIRLS